MFQAGLMVLRCDFHDAVNHDFKTEDGDPRDRCDGHEVLSAMYSVGDAQRDSPNQSSKKRKEKQTGESDSVALHELPIRFGTDGSGVTIPVNVPKQKDDDAEDGTEVLQDRVPGTTTEQRKRNINAEKGKVAATNFRSG